MNIWTEWGRITRYLRSARIAFAREQRLWESLELSDPDKAVVHTVSGVSKYSVSLRNHCLALEDEELLYASVLIYSYTLAESTAADELGVETRGLGGIEDWASRLLEKVGRSWSDVFGGKPGLVEVAIVRNSFAHGLDKLTESNFQRMSASGNTFCWKIGDPIALTFESLCIYRDRLRSLLRLAMPKEPPQSADPDDQAT